MPIPGARSAAPPSPGPTEPRAARRVHRTGLALAALGAIAFSGKAVIVKLAYRHGVDAVTLLMYRMLFALPLFVAIAWWFGRGRPALARSDWWGVAGLGFTGYYLASFLDFAGLAYISASLERLILYLNPTLVVLSGWLLFGRRIGARQGLGMAISYAGIGPVFGHEMDAQGGQVWLGSLLVLGSAISYTVYLVSSGRMVERIGSLRLVGLASTVACVLCLAQFLVLRPMAAAAVAPEVLWLSVANAVLCTAVPVVLVMMAIERIGPGATAQTGLVGPIATILLGALLLGEPLTAWSLVGSALVLAGIVVFSRSAAR